MQEIRKTLAVGLLGVVVGAILMAVVPAGAGNGDNLVLGRKNFAGRDTFVRGKGTVVFDNATGAGEPAASFKVVDGPPFVVNSADRVPKLNADRLDGLHASAFALDEEGLGGDYYLVAVGSNAEVVNAGPWTLELRCESVFYPPPVTYARLRLSIEGASGSFSFAGTGWTRSGGDSFTGGEGYLTSGQWGQWNVTGNSSGVDIGQVRLDAVGSDGTVLRVIGALWSDPDECQGALQVIPVPGPLGAPLPAP